MVPDAKPDPQLELLAPIHSDVVVVNGRCELHEEDDLCVVVVSGTPVYRFHRNDRVERALFVAQALASGYAGVRELASALGMGERTVYEIQARYRQGGAQALIPKKTGRKPGQSLEAAELAAIRKWHEADVSGREIARRLKYAPGVVQKAIRRMGLPPRRSQGQQQSLLESAASSESKADPEPVAAGVEVAAPSGSAALAAVPSSPPSPWGQDPFDRSLDRFLASQGLLEDAEPLFASGQELPRVGALLAIPLLVSSGLFVEADRLYGSIGPAFYGLRTSLLVLVLMALLRIKHPECLKEYSPSELGRILGLDRAPEVKTVRRKLKRLSAGPSEALLEALARRRVAAREEAMGFLYVDGHVRVYSGKHRLPKAHVARMRMSLPAAQEVWVNDADGDPLFFVTQEAHPQLVSALPPVLQEVRELVGDERRITVVFDRGGWSPKLFKQMVAAGFDVLTYRKGKTEPVPAVDFEVHDAPGTGGRQQWSLHERSVWVGNKADGLWMRQVTRRQGDHQTHVLTTRQDLVITEVAYRMFARWRQENFLKYMRQEFAIDALLEYGFEEEDQLRSMPNPAWRQADKVWKRARSKAGKAKTAYADAVLAREPLPMELLRELSAAQAQADARKEARDALPERVTVADLPDEARTVRLPALRKRLSDGLKMLAYQVESDLVRAVAPHYARVLDEGRTLIAAALGSSGDLEVTETELRVTLAPQSSQHRTRAIAALCEQLDATASVFPGTRLRLRYGIRGLDCGDP